MIRPLSLVRGLMILALLLGPALPASAQDQKRPPDARPKAAVQENGRDDSIIPTQDWITRENDKKKVATTLEILLIVTVLALAPAILVMVTSFTRIVIVLSFLRRALSTQELPPNQVIVGLSLVLTFLVMSPTIAAVKRDAIDPYLAEKNAISQKTAMDRAVGHLRTFMFKHARSQDLALFMEITKQPQKKDGWTEADVPTEVLVPAFVVGELRRAFVMGFALFLPFLVIDMVVASLLMSMGMFMLPPVLVSLPFKILLFVLVDGWALVVGSLLRSFT